MLHAPLRRTTVLLCCLALSLCALGVVRAEEAGKKPGHKKKEIDNVGFMENPPKELVERFPMCDAFWKVEWIK